MALCHMSQTVKGNPPVVLTEKENINDQEETDKGLEEQQACAGEVAQSLEAPTLEEAPASVPSTHTALITTSDSSLQGSDAPFWPLQALACV